MDFSWHNTVGRWWGVGAPLPAWREHLAWGVPLRRDVSIVGEGKKSGNIPAATVEGHGSQEVTQPTSILPSSVPLTRIASSRSWNGLDL